ncbi:hypothetical protein BraRD5C2_04090 [Bradyrhizobium sp. RD5-C2]|nr:hypothetical protein BraRD5C2_04090 [Bradyrhizobium sp. RD5-C2]
MSLDFAKSGAKQPSVMLDVLLVHAQLRNLSFFHLRPLCLGGAFAPVTVVTLVARIDATMTVSSRRPSNSEYVYIGDFSRNCDAADGGLGPASQARDQIDLQQRLLLNDAAN